MILSSKWRRKVRGGAALLFFLYLFALAYALFFAEMYGRTVPHTGALRYNFVPFTEIRRFFRYRDLLGNRAFFANIAGNVIGFMPYGFFLPLVIDERKKGCLVCISGSFVSLCVECIQLITRVGSFDVDDILLNSIGTVMGYGLLSTGMCIFRQAVRLRQTTGYLMGPSEEPILQEFVFVEDEEEVFQPVPALGRNRYMQRDARRQRRSRVRHKRSAA